MHIRTGMLWAATLTLASACATELTLEPGDFVKSDDKSDTSAEAVFLDFELDGELVASSVWNAERMIEDQMLYTIGQLNGDRSVGRLDKLVLTNVQTERVGELTRVTYHATMPVAWGKRNDVPASYTFKLPRDNSYAGLDAFTAKYNHDCVDWGAHDVTSGSMWYYYRPNRSGCNLAAEDVVEVEAAVSVSAINTTGKFPEYDKVWEDGELRIVAVFGKYEDGATTASDAGIAAYNEFVGAMQRELRDFNPTTAPATVPPAPGIGTPDITFEAELAPGRRVVVVALLVDNVRTAGATFDARYEALSTRADMIAYNGHAGLGANIRALAQKGRWVAGQYVVVFMNGCDTYAYVDNAIGNAHAAINADDPAGTKYVDIATNAMPSYFSSMPNATMALVRGLMAYDAPKTYEQIFRDIDRSQVVLVSGEQDNTYVPGGGGDEPPVDAWDGLAASGAIAKNEEQRWSTPTLPAGAYEFVMSGTGDADLYVRIGAAPTEAQFDCRPYRTGSDETCTVQLPAPAQIHVMVRGWAQSSTFELVGRSVP